MDLYELNEPHIEILMKMELEFGFEQGFLCTALAKLLGYSVYRYEYQKNKQKKERLSKTKKELTNIENIISQLEQAFKSESLRTQVALRLSNHGEIQKKLEELLNNEYKPSLSKEILSIKDSGRLPGSPQQFLISSLLKIYAQGTKKPLKVGVDSAYQGMGVGETHDFLMKIQGILSEISEKFYLGTSQSIAVTANKIINEFSKISIFSNT